jgi:hypothetical protein
MHFDEHWRIHWSPREFFDLADEQPRRLINQYLLRATPRPFRLMNPITLSSRTWPLASTSRLRTSF